MKPEINVTPLIDVLLVLLIIFMVVSPHKPSKFETHVPSEPGGVEESDQSQFLVARIHKDSTLGLNETENLGTTENPRLLAQKLSEIFSQRKARINYPSGPSKSQTFETRIPKLVFIKAPKGISYGDVVKVVDAIKLAGANPISLQIDDLE